ncbi:MAG: glycosyltransferase family 2 protein [Bacteroidales bacterium]|nr:glycosyltransferase family 2 protein [Bacteroidales bacterium]
MKLFIQIPCLNEEETLPLVINDLPNKIDGIDDIQVLVIDDGSTDNTLKTAENLGVRHIVKLGTNRGLAYAFMSGLNYCLEHGADIVVNTDGDNQYKGEDIARLVQPILDDKADIVVGSRPIMKHKEFSLGKKILQLLGSMTLRLISKTKIKDAPSGFRAMSRKACFQTYVYSRFSYTMETLIQAGNSNMRVRSVDVRVNQKTRKSRLFRNSFEHVSKSSATIMNMFVLYRPGRFFSIIASLFLIPALILGIRFIYLVFITPESDPERTYIPSLILLAIFSFIGIFSIFLGIIGELIKQQRKLMEDINQNLKELKFGK